MGSVQNEDGFDMEESRDCILYVNGIRRTLPDGLAHKTLLQYLRESGLTGTKLGCGEGGCGACTVMVSYHDPHSNKIVHYAINACLAPLYSVEGMHVITVEGIGSCRHGLHPVQERLANSHGSQCGFCTPGFVMSMYALLRSKNTPPTEADIEENLAGNLCRCTGYRPIVDAFCVFAKTNDSLYCNGFSRQVSNDGIICPSTGNPCSCSAVTQNHEENSPQYFDRRNLYKPLSYSEVNGNFYSENEFIFPPELMLRKIKPLSLSGFGGIMWYRPIMLKHVLNIKSRYPCAKLVVGNTEIGIETRLKNMHYPVLVCVTHVPELNGLHVKHDGLEIGAAVRVIELLDILRKIVKEHDNYQTSSCKALIEQLKWFAGRQIKNVASIGGNICTASPISDLNPLWMASRAQFRIIDCHGNIRITHAKDFFLGYRNIDLSDKEILLSVFLPWTRNFEYVKEFKQSHRRDDDIAIVNAGMRVFLEERDGKWTVHDSSIVYGGVAPISLSASKVETFINGKVWNEELLMCVLQKLKEEIPISNDAPGGMIEFRKSLILSFFFKFFLWVSHQMSGECSFTVDIPPSYLSAVKSYCRPCYTGSQNYEIIKDQIPVGLPEAHLSSRLQVTGEAEYADDVPLPINCLHAALVLSQKAHARILSIDDSQAKSSPGFRGLFLAKDVPGNNNIGPVFIDEELFATKTVTCVGQVVGVVVADTHENAKLAAGNVHIDYEELPTIFSIKDALASRSFYPNSERFMQKGDVDLCFQSGACNRIIEGEVQVGGQEHFYLEPQCTLIWPIDCGNEVHMISSTQSPQKHQNYVSMVLNLPMSKVVCKTKRIGGGFGGKETRSAFIAAIAAVPAYLLKHPVKITLDRDVDMSITGQRHSFLGKYKVGFTNEGKVLALDLELYANAGNSLDLSLAVLDRAMLHSDNVYDIPNIRIHGKLCRTNLSSNTAFRGFGGPQAMLIAENWIQRVATELQKSSVEIREINFQYEGYVLHYDQRLLNCTLKLVWDELLKSCDFNKRREEVDHFNLNNRWKKRGIAVIPTKFGISFTVKHMNQAGALVQVYTDGTVLVTHGGVEMGQGLHTKVAQIAASSFNIPLSSVFISETSTDKIPNASPTAASASSDLYGAAVLDACEQIKSRMDPIASKIKANSFAELAQACYMERVDLSAHGFYITPDIDYDSIKGKGTPFNYFTFGTAFAEVEIDTLTGDFYTRSADIVMDLGCSINPAIDVGQIEGAFVQGLGWVALEELKWGDAEHKWIKPGSLYTCGPGSYKLPTINDMPLNFKVSLLKGVSNVKAIHSSKAVGEPPFFLAASVFFAIKDAISAARAEAGIHGWFPLDNPATPERIRMACADEFTNSFAGSDFRPKLSI